MIGIHRIVDFGVEDSGDRNEPAICPECSTASLRVFVSAPRLACECSETRFATDTHERARHEPGLSKAIDGSHSRFKHPAGCGGFDIKKGHHRACARWGQKLLPSKRPWMISH